MIEHRANDEALSFLPGGTVEEALRLGRAVARQWRGRDIAIAREEGQRPGLLSLAAVAGIMDGGAGALDYGIRTRGELHYLRDTRCPVALYFRETPCPEIEIYAGGGLNLEQPYRDRLLDIYRQDPLPPAQLPGRWVRHTGGRDDYLAKLLSLAPRCLEGITCRFDADRETRALGNHLLSVLGVRTTGSCRLVLDTLGRLTGLQREGKEVLGQKQIASLISQGEELRTGQRGRPTAQAAWLQDGLMAGIMLLDLLHRGDREAAGTTVVVSAMDLLRP